MVSISKFPINRYRHLRYFNSVLNSGTLKITQVKRTTVDFQQPVDEERLKEHLERELSGEQISEVTELDAGLFNNTYQIKSSGGDRILKIAPTSEADVFFNERNLMKREQSISKALQSSSPLIPEYLAFFEIDGRDASLQPLIPGRLWHDVMDALTEKENQTLWKQLGAFAKQLHQIHGERFGYPEPAQGFENWSGFIETNVKGMTEDIRRLGLFCEEIETYNRLLPEFYQVLDQVTEPCLLHGDLWPRNVIIEGQGSDIHLKAVIDGERAYWGDPISDWVLILYDIHDAFWEGYGENLFQASDPTRVTIYKGMYFILNILETARFNESPEEYKALLSGINQELGLRIAAGHG
jgi:aminoglycoside phosphotransferase (APT) family kinase protein